MIRMYTNKNKQNTILLKKNISKNQLHFDQQDATFYINVELNQDFENEIKFDDDKIYVIKNKNDNVNFVLKNEKNVFSQHKKRNKNNQFLNSRKKRVQN